MISYIWLCATIFRWTVYCSFDMSPPEVLIGFGTLQQLGQVWLWYTGRIKWPETLWEPVSSTDWHLTRDQKGAKVCGCREGEDQTLDHYWDLQPDNNSGYTKTGSHLVEVNHLFICIEMCYSWSILLTLCDHKLWACHKFADNTTFFLLYFCQVRWKERRVETGAWHIQIHVLNYSATLFLPKFM